MSLKYHVLLNNKSITMLTYETFIKNLVNASGAQTRHLSVINTVMYCEPSVTNDTETNL